MKRHHGESLVSASATMKYADYEKNEHGVPQLPKGHAGRLLVTLAAIDYLERPTVTSISQLTGLHRALIDDYVKALNSQFLTQIERDDSVFRIDSWGPLLKTEGIVNLLTSHFI
ncbi:hypothetical protein ACCD10_20395 [Pseudomonas sp. Pseusp122]|uniref:hypothetical protein n=1 Tax=unclassified Pseudomonas TaxID=196821 RepID=UPI0039A6AE94